MGDVCAEDLAELEAIARSVRGTPADDFRELLAAREAAATAAPETAAPEEAHPLFGEPEFPGRLQYGAVRWSCREGCGWSHTETPGMEPAGPLVLPVGFGPDDLSAAVTRQAEERHRELWKRVEGAFAEHYATAHPGAESARLHAG
ncbi:hypothetical protein [Streptomyces variabilis]